MASSGMPSSWADASDSDGEDIPKSRPAAQPAPVQTQAQPPRQQQRPAEHSEAPPKRPQNEINPNGPFILFVGNLSFDVTDNDLGNFFYNGGCDVVDVKVQTDRETGRSRGFAHVEVRDIESLKKGLTAAGHKFMDRPLNVDVGKAPKQQERRGADRDRGFDRNRTGSRDRDRERGARPPVERDTAPLERGLKVERRDRPEKARTPKAAEAAPAAAPAPVGERKKIEIKPRTVPVGETVSSATPSSYSSIFGDAKPRDEKVVEKKVESALPEPPVEKKLEELKVSPPAAPVDETVVDKAAAADKATSKERRPTKPTWSEGRAAGRGEGRGEGRGGRGDAGRGERRDAAGRGRGGRGDRPDRDGKTDRGPRPARDGKPAAPKKGPKEAVEEKGKSTRPVNSLTDHVSASAVESQKTATNAKPKQVNMFAGLGDSDSDED